ncbi:hypothetical protein BOX15_Mlig004440g1 [Macrostomum lignano]|uniref:Transcription factor IIIC putative zinc-finger domain-containing protein n=1 Tax=Macrostomum lignano TaxID=282301 RepID=A0A267F2P6_9PLAT|nr:hypothetical protein BOX15_Mlig004440g1 [Macrostomum lignano]
MSSRLVFGGQPLLTGGCLVPSNSGTVAVLTSRGAAVLSLDFDPTWEGDEPVGEAGGNGLSRSDCEVANCSEGFSFRLTCWASLRDRFRLPLAIDPEVIESGKHLPNPLRDPLRAFHSLARRFPSATVVADSDADGEGLLTAPPASKSISDSFIKADWSPFEQFGRPCLAAVSDSGRLVLLSNRRCLLESESMALVSPEPGSLWCKAYVQTGRVVQPPGQGGDGPATDLNFLMPGAGAAAMDSDGGTDSSSSSYIWCDQMDEFALAVMDMCFVGVSWSRQMRAQPWHALLAGVTRSGVLVLFSYNPGAKTATLLYATYACAIGGGLTSLSSASANGLPSPSTLANFGLQACSLKICDLLSSNATNTTAASDGVSSICSDSLLALIGLCDGRVFGVKIRLESSTAETAIVISAGPEWRLWRWPDQLQPFDAVWSATNQFGCVAKGAHLVSFALRRPEGIAASTVTTSVNCLQITGMSCIGNSVYYCCLDGRLYCATFAPDTTNIGGGGVVCTSISELQLNAGPTNKLVEPNAMPYYYGLYCSRNGVILGVLEGRPDTTVSKQRAIGHLAFRLMCSVGEDRLVELLRSSDQPLSQKLDVLEAVRHVYYRDKFTSASFLSAELASLTDIMRNPTTLVALGNDAHNLRLLRFLLSLAGGQAARAMTRAAEGLMLMKHCGIALRQLCRIAQGDEGGKPQQLKRQLSGRDLRAAACMLDALRRACAANPRVLGAARTAWRLDAIINRAAGLLSQQKQQQQQPTSEQPQWENCVICFSKWTDPPFETAATVAMDPLVGVCCPNGHVFARCCRSLIPVTSSDGFLICTTCLAYCLQDTGGNNSTSDGSVSQPNNDWLGRLLSNDVCLFCDSPMVPVRCV